MPQPRPIPFNLKRNLKTSFVEQVADGFRSAIRTGYYRPGDLLPKQEDIAKMLGVSIRIPREVYRVLTDEKLVRTRRRIGCEVVGGASSTWRGRVLMVRSAESEGSYAVSIVFGCVRRRLYDAGYFVTQCSVDHSPSGEPDFAPLRLEVGNACDLVLSFYGRRHVGGILGGCKCPVLYESELFASGDASHSRYAAALEALVERCRQTSVRRILMAGYWPLPAIEDFLKGHGFKVEPLLFRGAPCADYLERLVRESRDEFLRRFAKGRRPDLVFCIDDYVARGALVAFAGLGLRMPDDVRFVTWANRGYAPMANVDLAQLEYDPRVSGENIAEVVLARLRGETSLPPLHQEFRFVDGPSLSGQ